MAKIKLDPIHNTLLEYGFVPVPGYIPCYKGTFKINQIDFELEISKIDISFIELPEIKLTHIPDGIGPNLTNISSDGTLCYIDKEGHYIDQFNPAKAIVWIIESVKKLLTVFTNEKLQQHESADEFPIYWMPTSIAYLRSDLPELIAMQFERLSLDGKKQNEVVIAESNTACHDWYDKRHGNEILHSEVPAITIQLNKIPTVPVKNNWPPTSLAECYEWLEKIDRKASQSLIDRLKNIIIDSNQVQIIVVLNTTSGPVGFRIVFIPHIRGQIKRFKKTSGAGKNLRTCLLSNKNQKSFDRYNISNASDEFVSTRNLTNISLKDKKIALIGCGTIGGYAGSLLAQAGAGYGRGKLDLYDADILKPDNLGRHILPVEYLGEEKSAALASYIKSTSAKNNVEVIAHGYFTKDDMKKNGQYDLIIDVTGDENFSVTLSHVVHKSNNNQTILHAWVDAGGLAVRALIDEGEGEGACYRCLRTEVNGELIERMRLLKKDHSKKEIPIIRRQCGNSFRPHATYSPIIAAGLVQQMTLDIINNQPKPKFRHISLSEFIQDTKNKNIKHTKGCPCCQMI